jgi:hypothetical protein
MLKENQIDILETPFVIVRSSVRLTSSQLKSKKPVYTPINELNEFTRDWELKCLISRIDEEVKIVKGMKMVKIDLRDK